MKKHYISPITDRMILPKSNVLVVGSEGEGFTPPPGMPHPAPARGASGVTRHTLIVK